MLHIDLAKWADLILEEINLKVKNQEIKKAERSIEFLENEIKYLISLVLVLTLKSG